jgi:hypothetical protein
MTEATGVASLRGIARALLEDDDAVTGRHARTSESTGNEATAELE